MRSAILPALLISFTSALPVSAAPADFGLKEGHPYSELSIDIDLTRERGGGKATYPYLWLSQAPAPNPGWDETSVVATPQTGVCAVSGYTDEMRISENQLEASTRDLLTRQLQGLSDEMGRHLMMVDGEFVASYGLEEVLAQIETNGAAYFASVAESRSDVQASEFYIAYDGGAISAAYRLSYQNAQACDEVITQ
jgi:hypothetical protein